MPVAGIVPVGGEDAVERRGQDNERGQHEPHHAPNREQREDERDEERGLLEEREPRPAAAREPRGEQRDEVERRRAETELRRRPLGDVAAESRVEQELVVVADEREAVWRCEQQRGRGGKDRGHRESRAQRAVALEKHREPAESDQRGGEERRAVDVGPEDDDRQCEKDATRVLAAVLGEQPEERDEEREDEALYPKRPRPPRDDEERAE